MSIIITIIIYLPDLLLSILCIKCNFTYLGREESSTQTSDGCTSSLGQTSVWLGVGTGRNRCTATLFRYWPIVLNTPSIAVTVPLLQVRHRCGLLQLLLLDDGPVRVRRRRCRPTGHRSGCGWYKPVQSGQPVTHRARNRGQQWVTRLAKTRAAPQRASRGVYYRGGIVC